MGRFKRENPQTVKLEILDAVLYALNGMRQVPEDRFGVTVVVADDAAAIRGVVAMISRPGGSVGISQAHDSVTFMYPWAINRRTCVMSSSRTRA